MRIKLKLQTGITLKDLMMLVAMFCVVSYALLEHASISVPVVSLIKTPLMYLGAVCILCQFFYFTKRLKKKRYFYLFLIQLLLCVLLFLSAEMNERPKFGDPPLKDTIRLVLYMVELFMVMVWVAETGKSKLFLDFVFYYVLILTVITDVLLFTGIITFTSGRFETYLIGTKFSVSYAHMNLMTLWFVRNRGRFRSDKKARRVIYWGMPIALLTIVRVDCMSGVLGCLVLFVLFILMDRPAYSRMLKLNSPWVLLLAMSASVIFPFISESILNIPFVVYIVENVLGRDNKLTGRLNIFEVYSRETRDYWMWGFGYGNGNAAAASLFGYENSQNALLQWVLQVGVPATVCLVLFMLVVFRQLSHSNSKARCMPFVALIYMYIVLGMIETTFSMSLIMWFAVIFMLVNEHRAVPQLKTE